MAKWKYFNDAEFIWNGEWNDPQLEYKGEVINSHVIEDTLWDRFNDYAEEEGLEANEENFTVYCNNNQDDIKELFEIAIEQSVNPLN